MTRKKLFATTSTLRGRVSSSNKRWLSSSAWYLQVSSKRSPKRSS